MLLQFLEIWYRDVAHFGVTGRADGACLHALASRIADRARTMRPEEAASRAMLVQEHRDLIEGNVNPRMVFERLAMAVGEDDP